MLFKRFLIWSSGGPPVQNIYANLKEGIIGTIHVKLVEIWTGGSGKDVIIKKKFTHNGCTDVRRTKTDNNSW